MRDYSADYEMMNDPHSFVPHHIRDGFKLWIENGINPGSFVMSVLENNLSEALGRADHINRDKLHSIVCWLYNFAPSDCWGSPEIVKKWEEKFK